MRKILFLGLLLASSFSYAQQADTIKKAIQKNAESIGHGGVNEFKLNLLYAVIGMPEISYERILADNMGIGASMFVALDDDSEYRFGFTPHFRVYFGQKKANGFFIEGNASVISSREDYFLYSYSSYAGTYPTEGYANRRSSTNFGMGAAVGGKFLTRNGFLGEAYLGVGRLFGNTSYVSEAYPRIGITLGKRF